MIVSCSGEDITESLVGPESNACNLPLDPNNQFEFNDGYDPTVSSSSNSCGLARH